MSGGEELRGLEMMCVRERKKRVREEEERGEGIK